jgi:acyl-lipid omega-6 desaturase (Delta-12 desaturase)
VTFALDLVGYSALMVGALAAKTSPVRTAFGLLAGFFIFRLFVLSHDACHGSLTDSPRLNRFIAQVGFLLTGMPYRTWQISHNVIHHGYQNLKGKDYVWIPFTKEEYDRLPRWRRLLERLYRGPFGHGFYYFNELWLIGVVWPTERYAGLGDARQRVDYISTMTFLIVHAAAVCKVGSLAGNSALSSVLFCWFVPFMTWCYLMGFTLYVHHTHPTIPFFQTRLEWSSFQTRVRSSTHVVFPGPVNRLLHGIMEHTAHHLNTKIPLSQLGPAQECVERELGASVVVERWTAKRFFHNTRTCKLYDYTAHTWLDFAGTVTAKVDVTHASQFEFSIR